MKIALGADHDGFPMLDLVKETVVALGHEPILVTKESAKDFIDSAVAVSKAILCGDADRGIMLDQYGVGSFMASNKIKGMITAAVSDEYSARMTFNHNDAKAIAIGTGLVGKELLLSLVRSYLTSHYAGGRHQIRVDMLNKML